MVAAVAADEPEIAAKMPQPITLQCISRPGNAVSQGARPRNISSEMRLRNRISPIQMNKGTAVSDQLALDPHTVVAMSLSTGVEVKSSIAAQPMASSTMVIHQPPASSSASKVSRNSVMPSVFMALYVLRHRDFLALLCYQVGRRAAGEHGDEVVEQCNRHDRETQGHAALRHPQRHRHQSLRHVIDHIRGPGHVDRIPGEEADQESTRRQAQGFQQPALAAAE